MTVEERCLSQLGLRYEVNSAYYLALQRALDQHGYELLGNAFGTALGDVSAFSYSMIPGFNRLGVQRTGI